LREAAEKSANSPALAHSPSCGSRLQLIGGAIHQRRTPQSRLATSNQGFDDQFGSISTKTTQRLEMMSLTLRNAFA
jgi:hypothetical protein